METILFASENNEWMARELGRLTGIETGSVEWHRFPDGESLVRINSDLENKHVYLCCSLHQPDEKFIPLFFFSKTCRDLGAKKISLISPYLPYLRQDKIFKEGEGLTSAYFAELISSLFEELITIDPHLHRWKILEEIYTSKCITLHATDAISKFISEKIKNPVLIGPDSESSQWVNAIAEKCGVPSVVLRKKRSGDNKVEIIIPDLEKYKDHSPVLIDDIISSGTTMVNASEQIRKKGHTEVTCIAVHAVFTSETYNKMMSSGIKAIHTTNTIQHKSNAIDILPLIAKGLLII